MAGQREAAHLCVIMRDIIETPAIARVDYVSVAHPDTLAELDWVVDRALLSLAVFIGEVRLIDNLTVNVSATAARQPSGHANRLGGA